LINLSDLWNICC